MAHNASSLPQWTLADRLRKIRRDRHMTQDEFADVLGVKAVTLSAWEAGRTRPHDVVELAGEIERRFGVPAAWTLGVLTTPGALTNGAEGIPAQRRTGLPPVPPSNHYGRRWNDGMFAVATL